jgi:hypothetical protein
MANLHLEKGSKLRRDRLWHLTREGLSAKRARRRVGGDEVFARFAFTKVGFKPEASVALQLAIDVVAEQRQTVFAGCFGHTSSTPMPPIHAKPSLNSQHEMKAGCDGRRAVYLNA